jgi:hypothetical protein
LIESAPLPIPESVTVRATHRWILTASFGVIAAYILVLFGPSAGGIALTGLPAVNIALVLCARLSADRTGVTVVNFWPGRRIPWTEIDDFRVGRSGRATCLDVWRRDGTRVHALVTTYGLPWANAVDIDELVQRLRQVRATYTGEFEDEATRRALERALAEADAGHYATASKLVAEGRVDAVTMSHLSIERHNGAPHEPATN